MMKEDEEVVHTFIPIVNEEKPITRGIVPPISMLLQLKKQRGTLWPMFLDATNKKQWGALHPPSPCCCKPKHDGEHYALCFLIDGCH